MSKNAIETAYSNYKFYRELNNEECIEKLRYVSGLKVRIKDLLSKSTSFSFYYYELMIRVDGKLIEFFSPIEQDVESDFEWVEV